MKRKKWVTPIHKTEKMSKYVISGRLTTVQGQTMDFFFFQNYIIIIIIIYKVH